MATSDARPACEVEARAFRQRPIPRRHVGIAQREHLVRLHPDRNAPRAIVIAFSNRDPDAAVADRVDRVHEDAQSLVERRRALDVDQRGVQREIVIPVTKQRANPARSATDGSASSSGKLLGRPPLFGGDRCGFDRHATYCLMALCAPTAATVTGSRNENVRRQWLHHDIEWRHSHEVSIGLHRPRRIRLDSEAPAGCVQHAGIGAEVLAQQSPSHPYRIPEAFRREDAQVQQSVILSDAGARA